MAGGGGGVGRGGPPPGWSRVGPRETGGGGRGGAGGVRRFREPGVLRRGYRAVRPEGSRCGKPLWRLLGGFDPAVPCYAGGIDLEFTLDALLKQTDDNLAKGFRAIKMKVGRARLSEDA